MSTRSRSRLYPAWIWVGVGGSLALLMTGIIVAQWEPGEILPDETADSGSPPPLQRVAVAALGRIAPEGDVIQVSGPVGDRVGELTVSEGDWLEANTILAYLESYNERLAERNLAAVKVVEAEERLQAETAYRTAQIAEADTRIDQVDLPRRHEIEAQAARIRQLQTQVELAQADLNRSRMLYDSGAISRQDYDQQATRLADLAEQIRTAEATLAQIQQAQVSDRRNAEAQAQSAAANLPLAQAQVEVESARQNLSLAEARLDRTLIRAPQSGRVLRILTHPGEAIPQTGGIVELGDTRTMLVVAEVYETDVSLVKLGQPAVITSRNGAFDAELTGTVTHIGWQIFKNNVLDDDPAANADARVVEVEIALDNPEPVQGLTNLQVDVRIDIQPQ